MDRVEMVLVNLFSTLREELKEESGIGLSLKAQGRDVTLRVRSQKQCGDESRPFFALVVGAAERNGAVRVSYCPSGTPSAERRVTIVDADSADELLALVRQHVEMEHRRLLDHRRGT